MAAIMLMAAIGVWAALTDRASYLVTYGVSMNPVYHAGDLVIVTRADSYEIGQIAAYYGADGKVEVLHRIIGGDAEGGFVFKGDNNSSVDPVKPTADELIGRAVLHVPKVGSWLKPLLSPTSLGMVGFLIVSGGAAAVRSRRDIPRGQRKKRVKGMSSQGGSWAVALSVAKAVGRLHPMFRALAVVAVACGVAGLALGVLGWMRPATQTVAGTGTDGELMTFSYSAEVPRSAAYDGTTVYSPEPVYRNLADLVDLTMAYQGLPGRIETRARLSAASGWHTTMQLSQPRRFTAARYTDSIQLDLKAFDEKARAASEAIGADVGALTIAVTAYVRHDDDSRFEPSVSFGLAPLQLTLAGGADSLVVNRSGSAGGLTLQARQIGVFGQDLFTAAQARRYAASLLLAAVALAGAIAAVALRHVPLRTREQIERRYPHLLVPVEPMPSPPGKPVVIVDSFPALVRLAEKYGQMILTWTRPDNAEDFVVRDDGVTYRYRIAPPPVPLKVEPGPAVEEEPAEAAEAAQPAEPPAKRATRPRKKAAPKAAPESSETTSETVSGSVSETAPEKPAKKTPVKRTARRKPETDRAEMESLAELNKSVGGEPEPLYDFLPQGQPRQDGDSGR
jgi:signal peptidase I